MKYCKSMDHLIRSIYLPCKLILNVIRQSMLRQDDERAYVFCIFFLFDKSDRVISMDGKSSIVIANVDARRVPKILMEANITHKKCNAMGSICSLSISFYNFCDFLLVFQFKMLILCWYYSYIQFKVDADNLCWISSLFFLNFNVCIPSPWRFSSYILLLLLDKFYNKTLMIFVRHVSCGILRFFIYFFISPRQKQKIKSEGWIKYKIKLDICDEIQNNFNQIMEKWITKVFGCVT